MGTIVKINDIFCGNISKLNDVLKVNSEFWDDNSFCPPTFFSVKYCCDNEITSTFEDTVGLNIGDVFSDTDGNCWEIDAPKAGPGTVTFSQGFSNDCNSCMENVGCNWEVLCCTGGPDTKIVNDLGFGVGTIGVGTVIKCGDNVCRYVNKAVLGPPNETIQSYYDDCVGCSNDSGSDCS